ncbi:SACE_7040 family transcriptional regulator [Mycolicibacterium mengxianglii]|uniref:SACE_7040 family transcriptional regulator n=1 Tax=Mycolicibacterium mengxianglii TaxID=2736649 RepID=UPI0018EF29DC|nr:TetR/AcrR family transcriptional regulator [Mycolicibacterium mengxianglii]
MSADSSRARDIPGGVSRRSQLKSDRRSLLLRAAERQFAERGFLAVRLEDIGAAADVSGPAIYRHFPNKEAMLVELLVGISTRLLVGGRAVVADAGNAEAALSGLVDFHLDFAFGEPDLIRIQDRDLNQLPAPALRQVRRSQREYVEVWVKVLTQVRPELEEADARLTAHAAFGLINSTPYSTKPAGGKPAGSAPRSREVLRAMTVAALRWTNDSR